MFTMHYPRNTIIITAATLLVLVVFPGVPKSVNGNEGLSSHDEYFDGDPIYCRRMKFMIACDYKWEKQQVSLTGGPAGEEVTQIMLKHVNHLILNISKCYDVSLTHIAEAKVEYQPNTVCTRMKASLTNVTLDFLGDPVINLYVYNSTVRKMFLKSVNEQLTIINSSIKVLKVGDVCGDVFVKVHDTRITHFESLHIRESAKLLLSECVIDEIPAGSLVLSSSGNTLSKVRFPATHDLPKSTLVLDPGANVNLQEVSGQVLVSCSVCSTPPTILPQAPHDHLHTSTSPATLRNQKEECYCSYLLPSAAVFLTIIISLICYIIILKKNLVKSHK
ncbi:uncharacterized protein [Cherax quadricarinatus]|uniref:uncharacterized protein isoform X2 n=1 Tax=Cherax quadricarinatus TaxID=27406 RepID=UPI00387E5E85